MFPSSTYPDLFDRLRMAGFEDGPGQRYKANLLIAELTGRLPDEPERAAATLADHLRPLFQRREEAGPMFDAAFKAWAEDSWNAHLAELPDAPPKPPAPPEPPGGVGDEGTGRQLSWWQRLGLNNFWVWMRALIAAGVIGGAISLVLQLQTAPVPVDIVDQNPQTQTGQEDQRPTGPDELGRNFDPNPGPNVREGETDLNDRATLMVAEFVTEYLRQDGAPTVRELHSTGMYRGYSAEEAAAAVGVPVDHPISPTMGHIYRHVAVAFKSGFPDEYPAFVEEFSNEFDLSIDPRSEAIGDFQRSVVVSFEDEMADMVGIGSWEELGTTPEEFEQAIEIQNILLNLTSSWTLASTFDDHDGSINSIDYNQDGTLIVSGSDDSTARLWDAESGAVLHVLEGHTGWVLTTEFSPDGLRVVSGSQDGTVRIWDAENGAELSVLNIGEQGGGAVYAASYSPDQSRIATGAPNGALWIWDAETEAIIGRLEGHASKIYSAAYSPDGTRIVTGSGDDTIRVWDAETFNEIMVLTGHEGTVFTVAYSPDGTQILSSSGDSTVRLWDADTGAEISVFQGHERIVRTATFSPDGARIASGSDDFSLRVWDAETGEELTVLSNERGVYSVAFTPDGRRLARSSGDRTVRIWTGAESIEPAIEAMRDAPWTTKELAEYARGLAEASDVSFPEGVTDAQLARQFAATVFHQGYTVHLSDPPWQVAPSGYEPPAFAANLGWWVAGALALAGIFGWIISALNLKSYLRRRRPNAPGRVIDLFSERRKARDLVQEDVREAARAMMTRTAGRRTIDIDRTIRATARAGGFFTAVETHAQRLPEYLFLIDSQSRADHEARRALDYVNRLEEENVRVSHAFFEQAPDRVREKIGDPGKPLEDYAAENSDKILVVVGDAANMLEQGSLELGAWKEALNVWKSKILLSTVPTKEWGVEEESVAKEGLNVRPLSAGGLASMPEALQLSEFGSSDVGVDGALAIPPLPRIIRRDPERWIFEDTPDDDDIAALEAALAMYLEMDGWRWLCACAVYPVIEWDLTVALGQVLEHEDGTPLFSEALAARLAELPWMREGHMPGWLRARLIETLEYEDREAVRGLIAEILDAVETERKAGGASISLSFSHTNGRAPDADERFVDFVTRAPEKRDRDALSATRKLRQLLRPSYLKRLTDIGALSWIVTGGLAALAALMVLPDLSVRPASTHAWTPLVLLALLTGGIVLAARSLSQIRKTDFGSWWTFDPVLARDAQFGRGRRLARQSGGSDAKYSRSDVEAALSRRVSIWLQATLIWSAFALIALSSLLSSDNLERLVPANWTDTETGNWLSALRETALGELGLTLGLLIAFIAVLAFIIILLRWLQSAADSVANVVVYKDRYSSVVRRPWLRNLLHLFAALLVSALVGWMVSRLTGFENYTAIFFVVPAFLTLLWHWATGRRYSSMSVSDRDRVVQAVSEFAAEAPAQQKAAS